jgi:hypothetical protein
VSTDIKELRQQAGYVFVGTVERLGAVAMQGVEASDSTAVIRVDHVVHAPPELGGRLGPRLTLDLAGPGLKEGDTVTFFATSWVFGEGLALREIGHAPVTDAAEASGLVTAADSSIHDDALRDRVSRASLAVLGTVASIQQPPETAQRVIRSEHEAIWWVAEIDVEETLKGRRPRGLRLAFPTTRDVAWYGAPRPQANQHAVWLLHKEEHEGLPRGAYVALDPRDVQPASAAERVRQLAGEG